MALLPGKDFRTALSYEERGHVPWDTMSDNLVLTHIYHDEVQVAPDTLSAGSV